MFKRSRIAMLVAGALFAAQAGAHAGYSEAIWSDSFPLPEQITVFNPDGSSYSIVPIVVAANEPLPEHLTVFEPDGLIYSYEFTLVEPVAMLEPIDAVAMEDDVSIGPVALSDEDANAFDVALMEDDISIERVALSDEDAFDVALMEDDVSIEPVALSDEDADAAPVYVAHFVSPPTYTGILEEAIS